MPNFQYRQIWTEKYVIIHYEKPASKILKELLLWVEYVNLCCWPSERRLFFVSQSLAGMAAVGVHKQVFNSQAKLENASAENLSVAILLAVVDSAKKLPVGG